MVADTKSSYSTLRSSYQTDDHTEAFDTHTKTGQFSKSLNPFCIDCGAEHNVLQQQWQGNYNAALDMSGLVGMSG